MPANACRKKRARDRKATLGIPYTTARHTVPTADRDALCPDWCTNHRDHPGDELDPTDEGTTTTHYGQTIPVTQPEGGKATTVQLVAEVGVTGANSVNVEVIISATDDVLWLPITHVEAVSTALTSLLDRSR